MGKGTKYILKKKCVQCDHINSKEEVSCTNCRLLFIGECTPEEENQTQEHWEACKSKARSSR